MGRKLKERIAPCSVFPFLYMGDLEGAVLGAWWWLTLQGVGLGEEVTLRCIYTEKWQCRNTGVPPGEEVRVPDSPGTVMVKSPGAVVKVSNPSHIDLGRYLRTFHSSLHRSLVKEDTWILTCIFPRERKADRAVSGCKQQFWPKEVILKVDADYIWVHTRCDTKI